MPRSRKTDDVLHIFEVLLKAQLHAIDQLRRGEDIPISSAGQSGPQPKQKRTSNTDMAYEVLKAAGRPLHIQEIIQQIQSTFGISVHRDTLTSALLKKVAQGRQFVKVGKNTFGLRTEDMP